MKKRINYTSRQKVLKSEVLITLNEATTPSSFSASFEFDKKKKLDGAKIYVEAHHRETRQRFCFGTVGLPTIPSSTLLDELDNSAPPLFRVLIVDESGVHGKIIASGDQFRVGNEPSKDHSSRDSLLPLRYCDLRSRIWRLNFESEDVFELQLNNQIPGLKQLFDTNPVYQALILPAALQQIFLYILFQYDSLEETKEHDYFSKWVQFGQSLVSTSFDDFSENKRILWIDDVIEAFSRQHDFAKKIIGGTHD